MLDFDAAQRQLLAAVDAPAAVQACPLGEALGRVLAHDVQATVIMPSGDNSAMDGYALRASDYAEGRVLPIQQRCYAGQMPEPLRPGHATRLFTGSLIPEGADTVVMQENASEDAAGVTIRQAPQSGQHIRRAGEDVAAGTTLAVAGTRLAPAHIAVLAAQGLATLDVRPRVRVGVLTTGDELVPVGRPRAAQQVFDSNGPMLAALLAGIGAEVGGVRHAVDDEAALADAFAALAADNDLVLSVGGASVGERDLVKPVLESLGGELALWKVRMKPGKPVALGSVAGTPVVSLPGNPVSAFAVFTVLVSPMIRRMQGRAEALPPVRPCILRTPRQYGESRDNFLRVRTTANEQGLLEATAHHGQTSGIMSALPWATGLARVPADTIRGDGDLIDYYAFADWLQ